MTKKRTLNEYRQSKDFGYTNPEKEELTGIVTREGTKVVTYQEKRMLIQIKSLHESYPNNQEFGYHIRKFLRDVNII